MKRLISLDSLVLVLLSIYFIFSVRDPLHHPDLPWHLAGGLWMFENLRVPVVDFLGPLDVPWIAYSWFPELIMALAYKVSAFTGLQVAQQILLAIVSLSLILLCRVARETVTVKGHETSTRSLDFRLQLGSWLALLLCMSSITRLWFLRPQVFSQAYFCILLAILLKKGFRSYWLIPLTVIWANTHLYWLLVPGSYFLCSAFGLRGDREEPLRACLFTAGLVLLGLINPYGVGLYEAMYGHLFEIPSFELYIAEFESLTPKRVVPFWSCLLILVLGFLFGRVFIKQYGWGLFILFLLMGYKAFSTTKYTPLFGISALPILITTVFPYLLSKVEIVKSVGRGNNWGLVGVILLASSFYSAVTIAPVEKYRADLYFAVEEVLESDYFQQDDRVVALTDFSATAWLQLYFWLQRTDEEPASKYRVAIDGRSLVVGEQRLEQYMSSLDGNNGWERIFSDWDIKILILPKKGLPESKHWKQYCLDNNWLRLDHGRWESFLKREVASVK